MDSIVNIFVILIFLTIGIQIFRGKWLFLIAGFNMSSTKEKSKVNIPIMSKIIGSFCLTIAALELVGFIFPDINTIITSIIFISLILTIIFTNVLAKKD
ncbi:hypothetical protein BW731_02215 [Vagococcus martis]|uniref:DUF3784 domain-containing protein n=1 Tax=Vagococcus martis TaxID=1768210 RepID=A0A1V4DFA5_9ENTE|nr:DUF3784 domain-containing protein [Vagococcus martis]OPF87101.1 hypothetical protein BW731_02215 [Vagococcus martis]